MDIKEMTNYVLAGRANFTLVDNVGIFNRYTYRVSQDKNNPCRFYVHSLYGPDNEQDYRYVGLFYDDSLKLRITKASVAKITDGVVAMFQNLLDDIATGQTKNQYTLYKSCRCARCGRRLTTPESIKLGLGPECATFV